MDANIVDSLVESRNMAAAKAAEIIKKRVDRVTSRWWPLVYYILPIPRLFRLHLLYAKAGSFLPKTCCCQCHK